MAAPRPASGESRLGAAGAGPKAFGGMSRMVEERIIEAMRSRILRQASILFAYLHGSALASPTARDIDLAVYVDELFFQDLEQNSSIHLDFAIPLELDLERAVRRQVDLQVLNRAPLSFRCRVASRGLLLVERDSAARGEFEYLARCQYFDFRRHRRDYVVEASR
jgi:predicted nucleotidyltransferase